VKYRKYDFSFCDDIEGRRKGYQKPEDEAEEKDPLIETKDIQAGYHCQNENKDSDQDFRQYVFFQAYDDYIKEEGKDFYPGINLLKEVVLSSSFPLDISGFNNIGNMMYALLDERHFQAPLATVKGVRGVPF